MRKQPTEAQKQAAKDRRERMRAIAAKVAAMTPEERAILAGHGVFTVEGRALSTFNQCMIVMQDPSASVVGGFQQWRKSGRQVRKGEKGLALWIPLAGSTETEAATDRKSERPRFMLGTVFDVTQTDPINAESEAVAA